MSIWLLMKRAGFPDEFSAQTKLFSKSDPACPLDGHPVRSEPPVHDIVTDQNDGWAHQAVQGTPVFSGVDDRHVVKPKEIANFFAPHGNNWGSPGSLV
jgi:hypothetical protein